MSRRGIHPSGNVAVLAAALLWGTSGTVAAFAASVSALAVGAAAMGVGGLLQAGCVAPTIAAHRGIIFADNWRILVPSAAAAAIYPLAFYSSMRMTGVAVGTVVSIGSAPLFAVVVEFRMDRQAPSRQRLFGITMGVAGVALLAATPSLASGSGALGHYSSLGMALGLVAGLTYCYFTWGATRIMRSGCPSHAAIGAVLGMAGLLLLPLLAVMGAPITGTPRNVAVVAYLVVVPIFVGYRMYGKGLATTTASTATTLTLFEPLVAALLAPLVLGERLSTVGWGGIVLLFASLVVMTRVPQSKPQGVVCRSHPSTPCADADLATGEDSAANVGQRPRLAAPSAPRST